MSDDECIWGERGMPTVTVGGFVECRVGDAESANIIPAKRYRIDDIVEQLSEPGNEADAWAVVEALAPKLAGPWELYDHRMARPKYARCTAFLADDTEARDHRAKADGWRLVE